MVAMKGQWNPTMTTTFHSRAYDKKRDATPERKLARLEYSKTKEGKSAHAKAAKAWRSRNKEKTSAHNAVANAIRSGEISRLPCLVCGSTEAQAHHEDYSKPLDVEWLCEKHHAERHWSEVGT